MRWQAWIACPKKCGGKIEVYESDIKTNDRVMYDFICSNCDYAGRWNQLAIMLKGSNVNRRKRR